MTFSHVLKRTLMSGAVAVGGLGAAAVAVPATASADTSCITPSYAFYPGSAAFAARYGEIDVTFTVCGGTSGNDIKNVSSFHTNATGDDFGLIIKGVQVVPLSVDGEGATYQLSWDLESCVPKITWPCYGSSQQSATFGLSTFQNPGPTQSVPGASATLEDIYTSDLTEAVYTTP